MAEEIPPVQSFPALTPMFQEDIKKLKGAWFWFLVLGVALIVLGFAALTYATLFTVGTMEVVGIFLMVGGVMYIGGACYTSSWSGFFLTLLMGVLELIVGLICFRHPGEAAIVYTLLMGAYFMASGLFRAVVAAVGQFRGRMWVLANGLITLVLGVMIWQQMPFSGLWVIGTFLGVDLIINGFQYLMLGLEVRHLPS